MINKSFIYPLINNNSTILKLLFILHFTSFFLFCGFTGTVERMMRLFWYFYGAFFNIQDFARKVHCNVTCFN